MERKKNIWRGFMDTPWWNVFTATCRLILKHWVLDIMQNIHTVKRYNTKNWINWPRSMWLYRKYEEPASTIKFDHSHKNGDCWEFLQARRQKYIRTHPVVAVTMYSQSDFREQLPSGSSFGMKRGSWDVRRVNTGLTRYLLRSSHIYLYSPLSQSQSASLPQLSKY